MGKPPLKKIEKPLVCFLRLYGPAKKRMEAVCKHLSTDHNSVAMAGTLSEIWRLERLPAEVTQEEILALTEVKHHGGDPVAILHAAIPALSEK